MNRSKVEGKVSGVLFEGGQGLPPGRRETTDYIVGLHWWEGFPMGDLIRGPSVPKISLSVSELLFGWGNSLWPCTVDAEFNCLGFLFSKSRLVSHRTSWKRSGAVGRGVDMYREQFQDTTRVSQRMETGRQTDIDSGCLD